MNLLPYLKLPITPFLMGNHAGIESESNVSLIARTAWHYRLHPSRFVAQSVLENSRRKSIDLEYDIASFCNSVTDKSESVTKRLGILTGLVVDEASSYSYLSNVLDSMGHGLISKYKKWCPLCYEESWGVDKSDDDARVADELFWSLSLSRYCLRHHCSLAACCGTCYQRQPYISNKYEPGFCHYCGASLVKAPCVLAGEDEHCKTEAENHLMKLDIFLPGSRGSGVFDKKILSRNLRGLVEMAGDNGLEAISECFGVSPTTLSDWCRSRHGLSLGSLLKIVEGLQLPKMSLLFSDMEELFESVGPLTKQFNFNVKKSARVRLPEISLFIREMASGKRPPSSRASIAKRFGVSKGMLEHAFKDEMKKISSLYDSFLEEGRRNAKSTLQSKMNVAVQRCASKNRRLDWAHIVPELKGVDFRRVTRMELNEAKDKAIKRYQESLCRDRSRDLSAIIL